MRPSKKRRPRRSDAAELADYFALAPDRSTIRAAVKAQRRELARAGLLPSAAELAAPVYRRRRGM